MADSLDDLREELDDEFRSFREELGKIREAVDALEKAGPEDDLSALLEKLEDVAKDVRTGGLHRRRRQGPPQGARALPRAPRRARLRRPPGNPRPAPRRALLAVRTALGA